MSDLAKPRIARYRRLPDDGPPAQQEEATR
jgi:hypothetical protein